MVSWSLVETDHRGDLLLEGWDGDLRLGGIWFRYDEASNTVYPSRIEIMATAWQGFEQQLFEAMRGYVPLGASIDLGYMPRD